MLAFFLISGVISPALLMGLLYSRITEQHDITEDLECVIQSKEDAQREVRQRILHHPLFWLYILFVCVVCGSGLLAYNVFGLGDLINI